jgi:hypothetical protein
MAEGKAGPPGNSSDPKSFQISISQDTWDYLELLAKRGKIAWKPQDIAAHLVTREVTAMQHDRFHELNFKT